MLCRNDCFSYRAADVSSILCTELCSITMPGCNHKLMVPCHRRASYMNGSASCNQEVQLLMPQCGHMVQLPCSKAAAAALDPTACTSVCSGLLPGCEHHCSSTCGQCVGLKLGSTPSAAGTLKAAAHEAGYTRQQHIKLLELFLQLLAEQQPQMHQLWRGWSVNNAAAIQHHALPQQWLRFTREQLQIVMGTSWWCAAYPASSASSQGGDLSSATPAAAAAATAQSATAGVDMWSWEQLLQDCMSTGQQGPLADAAQAAAAIGAKKLGISVKRASELQRLAWTWLGWLRAARSAPGRLQHLGQALTSQLLIPTAQQLDQVQHCLQQVHSDCRQSCTRKLACGHCCKDTCHYGRTCSGCKAPCSISCEHGRCHLLCAEPCAPCAEPCSWSCEHKGRCLLPCGVPCDRQPCNQRCPKALPCGHQCPGLCGEVCLPSRYCVHPACKAQTSERVRSQVGLLLVAQPVSLPTADGFWAFTWQRHAGA
jgi:hypothetical protein